MTRQVLVTEGSRGIGRATALELARAGFDLVVNYRTNTAAADETLRLVEAAGGHARLLPFDVAQRDECADVPVADVERHGASSGVVCNGGLQ